MAGKALSKDNLGYLGVDFQYKLIKAFVEDAGFFKELYPIVNQNVFSEPIMRVFVGVLKDYFKEWDNAPSYDTIKIILNSKARTDIDIEQNYSFIEKLQELSTDGIETVKEQGVKFFRQQNLIRISKEILSIAMEGDIDKYEECQKLFDEASTIGEEDDSHLGDFVPDANNMSPEDYTTHEMLKDEIADLFGDRTAFATPKPMKLIKEFVRAASEKDSIVLDFFAGSGTTGHAVMDLNKEDGGLRKFILITNNENNICQNITVPRIQKTIEFFNYKETFDFLA